MTQSVLVFLPNREEREIVRRVIGDAPTVHWCYDEEDAVRIAEEASVSHVLWDLKPETVRAAVEVQQLLRLKAATSPRLLLRAELKRSILRDLLQQALRLTDSVVSIRGFDAWLQDVTSFAKEEPAPSVEMRVLGHLSSSPSSRALDTVAATLFLAKRHVRVQQVADFLAVPRRTLEFHLKVARLPVPERLLGWSTALHTMWRLDVLRWPLKRAATHADFRTAAALANYLDRHVGARPAQLSQEGGFTALLERFLTVLERSTLRVAHQRRRLLVGLRPASAVLSS